MEAVNTVDMVTDGDSEPDLVEVSVTVTVDACVGELVRDIDDTLLVRNDAVPAEAVEVNSDERLKVRLKDFVALVEALLVMDSSVVPVDETVAKLEIECVSEVLFDKEVDLVTDLDAVMDALRLFDRLDDSVELLAAALRVKLKVKETLDRETDSEAERKFVAL